MNDLISIIVPVYNVEAYLARCIDSILKQTHDNIEIILVNDGSKDNSGAICDEFAEKDKRIRVIHQENKGVSASRNAGLDVVSGEWIGFVDSDDWIEPEMFEMLLKAAVNSGKLVAVCGFVKYHLNGWMEERVFEEIPKVLGKEQALEYMLSNRYYEGYIWNKLFSYKLIEGMRIRFDKTIHACEDLLFSTQVFSNINGIIYVNLPLYHYEIRENSSVSIFDEKRLTGLGARRYVVELVGGASESLKQLVQVQYTHYAIGLLYKAGQSCKNDMYLKRLRRDALRYWFIYFLSRQVCFKMKLRSAAILINAKLASCFWHLCKKCLRIIGGNTIYTGRKLE